MSLWEGPGELAFTSPFAVAGMQRWLGRMSHALGTPSEPWLRVGFTSLRSLLQARGHDESGGGMVACWERMTWPQRKGAPGAHVFLEVFGTGPLLS